MPRPKGSGSRSELVRLAIAGIDAEIQRLMVQRADIAKMSTSAISAVAAAPGRRGRKRASVTASTAAPAKKKRAVSAATRRKLKEAAKARWARIRAERGD